MFDFIMNTSKSCASFVSKTVRAIATAAMAALVIWLLVPIAPLLGAFIASAIVVHLIKPLHDWINSNVVTFICNLLGVVMLAVGVAAVIMMLCSTAIMHPALALFIMLVGGTLSAFEPSVVKEEQTEEEQNEEVEEDEAEEETVKA